MYKIHFHKLVLKKDLKKLDKQTQKRVLLALKKKLSKKPESFGKALSKELKGYYKLRIDPYRIVYRINGDRVEVFVLVIGMRRNAEFYVEAAKRLGLI